MKPVCGMVDAYSSGNFLPPEFKRRGYETIHVQSTPEIFPILRPSFNPQDFAQNYPYEGDLEKLLSQLRQHNLRCLVPGTETGVELADTLSEKLGLATNGTKLSSARRDKYEMIETMRRAGLAVAKQIKATDSEALCRWKNKQGVDRIVVKPISSAGAEGVRICHSDEAIHQAFAKVMGKTNLLGIDNIAVVGQEFLEGTEYFINAVSSEGHHHVTDIWRHDKRPLHGHDFVYDFAELRPSRGEVEEPLTNYLFSVLDAMEVKVGPSHTEIMWTPDGPKLIEIGTRIQGMSVPDMNKACIGYGPIDLTADAYLDRSSFDRKAAAPYHAKKLALRVNLMMDREATLAALPGEEKLRQFPSFFFLRWIKTPGMKTQRTVNYFTVPGFVVLVHENPKQLWADYEQIRDLEAQGQIFEFAP